MTGDRSPDSEFANVVIVRDAYRIGTRVLLCEVDIYWASALTGVAALALLPVLLIQPSIRYEGAYLILDQMTFRICEAKY